MAKLPENIAIRVEDIHKDFHLPHHREDSIKSKIITAFQKKDKEVDTQHALRGISFDIEKGDFFGILGRNGSGKSTLLKIISEIYQPTKGRVAHRGRLVAFIELGVGFNPQLTGRENVYLNAALLGFSRKETDEMYDDIVAFAELEDFMEQKLKNYSSGMKVRLAFSVAIRADADILILDEVLAVGDAAFQRKCYEYFQSLKDRNKTVVLVSHSMGAVREYCNRAVLIENGVVVSEGSADAVADQYLALFNKPSSGETSEGKRWGDQRVTIKNVKVETNDKELTFKFDTQAGGEPVEDVVLGFAVKDKEGNVVAGANTQNVQGGARLKYDPHETKSMIFNMPNVFRAQSYDVYATIRLQNGRVVCDSWENAASFESRRQGIAYPVLCPASLTINSVPSHE